MSSVQTPGSSQAQHSGSDQIYREFHSYPVHRVLRRDSGNQKKRQAISLEMKMAIIKKIDAGEKHVNVARFFQLALSIIGTIYKPKDRITEHGTYICSQCAYPLFSSKSKYAHSSPWPAFTETLREDSVTKVMERPRAYKILCAKCGNGLGHEFINDGPGEGLSRF